ncbi:MAG: response regulator [Chloroflexota bacterium]
MSVKSSHSTILVVDDEPVIRETLERLLVAEGYTVALASNGSQALEKAAALTPDVILLDVVMPSLDGFEVCRRLRADPLLSHVPVVMITALGERDARLRGLDVGADDFVTKPFDNAELLARVGTITQLNRYRRLLEEQAQRQQAEEELRERNRALSLLNRAVRVFSSTLKLDQVLAAVLEEVRRSLDVMACSVWLLDAGAGELVCRQATGPQNELVRGWRLSLTQGLVGWVARSGQSLVVADSRADERHFKDVDRKTGQEMRSVLSVPLRTKEEIIGVLQVVDVTANRFGQNDLTLVESLAASAAIAIENARLFEQSQHEIVERGRVEEALRRRNEELTTLNTIATAMGQSLALNRNLRTMLNRVLDVMDIRAGWVEVLTEKGNGEPSQVLRRGLAGQTVAAIKRLAEGASHTAEVTIVGGLEAALGGMAQGDRQGEQVWVGIPIRSRDKVLGTLNVLRPVARVPDDQEVQLFTAVGHQIGVTVENLRLAEEAAEIEILRELNRLRSELIANVSHELRTPLGLIKLFCTTLLRDDVTFDAETQREFLGHIDDEAEKLEKIVDNLLDLSQLESGRLTLDRRPTDLGRLASEVLAAMEIQRVGHEFVYDFPTEPLMATVDPKRIEQLLRNLLSNAIKYSPEGGTITVQGRGDRRQLMVRVSDEGVGIPTQDLVRVFERFYRVENEVTQRVRGAGLGLSVCKGIVEAHGGSIWVESTLGVGSTFYFTLPVGPGKEPQHE